MQMVAHSFLLEDDAFAEYNSLLEKEAKLQYLMANKCSTPFPPYFAVNVETGHLDWAHTPTPTGEQMEHVNVVLEHVRVATENKMPPAIFKAPPAKPSPAPQPSSQIDDSISQDEEDYEYLPLAKLASVNLQEIAISYLLKDGAFAEYDSLLEKEAKVKYILDHKCSMPLPPYYAVNAKTGRLDWAHTPPPVESAQSASTTSLTSTPSGAAALLPESTSDSAALNSAGMPPQELPDDCRLGLSLIHI